MIIKLPYPNPKLSPNKKNGRFWGATVALKKAAIDMAFNTTKELYPNTILSNKEVAISVTFVQPDRRRRDSDNLLASSKATLDGISRALDFDDYFFEPITIHRRYEKGASYMIVEIYDITS